MSDIIDLTKASPHSSNSQESIYAADSVSSRDLHYSDDHDIHSTPPRSTISSGHKSPYSPSRHNKIPPLPVPENMDVQLKHTIPNSKRKFDINRLVFGGGSDQNIALDELKSMLESIQDALVNIVERSKGNSSHIKVFGAQLKEFNETFRERQENESDLLTTSIFKEYQDSIMRLIDDLQQQVQSSSDSNKLEIAIENSQNSLNKLQDSLTSNQSSLEKIENSVSQNESSATLLQTSISENKQELTDEISKHQQLIGNLVSDSTQELKKTISDNVTDISSSVESLKTKLNIDDVLAILREIQLDLKENSAPDNDQLSRSLSDTLVSSHEPLVEKLDSIHSTHMTFDAKLDSVSSSHKDINGKLDSLDSIHKSINNKLESVEFNHKGFGEKLNSIDSNHKSIDLKLESLGSVQKTLDEKVDKLDNTVILSSFKDVREGLDHIILDMRDQKSSSADILKLSATLESIQSSILNDNVNSDITKLAETMESIQSSILNDIGEKFSALELSSGLIFGLERSFTEFKLKITEQEETKEASKKSDINLFESITEQLKELKTQSKESIENKCDQLVTLQTALIEKLDARFLESSVEKSLREQVATLQRQLSEKDEIITNYKVKELELQVKDLTIRELNAQLEQYREKEQLEKSMLEYVEKTVELRSECSKLEVEHDLKQKLISQLTDSYLTKLEDFVSLSHKFEELKLKTSFYMSTKPVINNLRLDLNYDTKVISENSVVSKLPLKIKKRNVTLNESMLASSQNLSPMKMNRSDKNTIKLQESENSKYCYKEDREIDGENNKENELTV